jgi:hypothetical protein
LADLLETTLDRHGHAVVFTIHGWNVVQATVDVGIGYRPGRHNPGAPPGPTASPAFVDGPLGTLFTRLGDAGITVSLGARYPARARENLLQLFTTRYETDPRLLVRRLASLGRHCEGAQLELGLPLRWPGPWRQDFVRNVVDAVPALLRRAPGPRVTRAMPRRPEPSPGPSHSLEFVSADLCGLAALDRAGGRLLLFERDGTLWLFTGERIGGEHDGHVGGLSLCRASDGTCRLHFEGPMLLFPDTMPFVDLEHGLAGASIHRAALSIDYQPLHAGCPFGTVDATLEAQGRRRPITGTAAVDQGTTRDHTARRLALDLGDGERLWLRSESGTHSTGFLCRAGTHLAVTHADFAPGDGVVPATIAVGLATGEERLVHLVPTHRLPVVRGASVPPTCVEFTACQLADAPSPAGWQFATTPPPSPVA